MLLQATCLLLLSVTVIDGQLKIKPAKPIYKPKPKPAPPAYTYMVLVPRNVRPATNLSIPVHFAKAVSSESVTAKLINIIRSPDRKETENIESEVTVNVPNGDDSIIIDLPIPANVSWGSYTVNVTGTGPVVFHNSTYVYGRPKTIAILVQSDKAMYKPGETVKYRVIAVDSALNIVDPLMDIEIFDPKGNKIDEQINVTNKFKIEGSLLLSSMTPPGRWRIKVTAREVDENTDYYFEVREYVLPKFEVLVELPAFQKSSDISVKGMAKAKYTFGDPVGGSAVLTISKKYGSSFFDAKAIRTDLNLVNGEASFNVPMDLLKRITRNLEDNFVFHVNITETITGQTLDGEGDMRIYSNPYKMEFFPNMANNFKPGFGPYKVFLKISQQDDSKLELTPGHNKTVTVTDTYFTDVPIVATIPDRVTFTNYTVVCPFPEGEVILKTTKTYPITDDGMVHFDLPIPDKTATMTIEAEFEGIKLYQEVRRFRSPTDTFLKSELINDVSVNPLKIGDIADIKIYSTFGPASAKWLVSSRGQIVESGDVLISGGATKEGMVQFKVTRNMAPTARFLVYAVKPDNEAVADGFNFVVQDIFENQVDIKFMQPSPQEPKAKVDLQVTADLDSEVNVLAVDKSVKLLAEGNDITQDRVKDEMNQFGDSPWIPRGWGIIRPWSMPADDVSDIFENAQLKVLTDADVFRFDLWSLQQTNTRSNTAMFASSAKMSDVGGAGGMAPQAVGQIRKDFPETWVWLSAKASGGIATFPQLTVPDTMTTFVASAFALSPKTGLGVAKTTADLTVRLPFFVNLQLPYSVVRNEIAVIQANIFNYLPQDQNVMVILKGSGDFVGISINNYNVATEVTGDISKCVLVKKDQPTPVYFNIKPTKVKKDMKIIIRAEISTPTPRFDEVHRDLIVEAEGIKKEKNTAIFESFTTDGSVVHQKTLVYPPELVPDSEYTMVTVFGDIFGLSNENLEGLIRMPYGCGEQNMINFAPVVFTAGYMRITGRLDNNPALLDKIKRYLKTGYQRQLIYQRNDGSFSAFGDADSEGSLWLTAFVLKSFAQAHPLGIIFIDPKVMEKAVDFILKYQNPDGTLNNVGIVSHSALQGGPAGDRAMLAYVLIALQEVKAAEILKDQDIIKKLNAAIISLTGALVSNIPKMTSDYERAIGAFALKSVMSPTYTTLLDGLENTANPNRIVKDNKKYWKNPSRALQIEIAAYALLTYSKNADKTNGLMILRWLIEQRNPYGGFVSTQDTVVALQAFTDFAAQIYSKDVAMTIDICKESCAIALPADKKQITLNNQNHDILQFVEFFGKIGNVEVKLKGRGLVLIDINQFYNVRSETSNAYDLIVTTSDETTKKYTVKACVRYKLNKSTSNMAILDFGAISGFEPMKDKVIETPLMKRIEMSGGRLVLYFDEIPKTEMCVTVPFQRVAVVTGVQPASVIAYSYYEPDEKIMKEYLPTIFNSKDVSPCKACDYVCCNTDNLLLPTAC